MIDSYTELMWRKAFMYGGELPLSFYERACPGIDPDAGGMFEKISETTPEVRHLLWKENNDWCKDRSKWLEFWEHTPTDGMLKDAMEHTAAKRRIFEELDRNHAAFEAIMKGTLLWISPNSNGTETYF